MQLFDIISCNSLFRSVVHSSSGNSEPTNSAREGLRWRETYAMLCMRRSSAGGPMCPTTVKTEIFSIWCMMEQANNGPEEQWQGNLTILRDLIALEKKDRQYTKYDFGQQDTDCSKHLASRARLLRDWYNGAPVGIRNHRGLGTTAWWAHVRDAAFGRNLSIHCPCSQAAKKIGITWYYHVLSFFYTAGVLHSPTSP